MTFQCWVFRRWVFEAYCREYPSRNLELGIPDVGHSRSWVFQMLGIPYENLNTVIRGAHDIHTCVILIRKSQSLTYCFLFININTVTRGVHDIRTCVLWEFLTLTYCFV